MNTKFLTALLVSGVLVASSAARAGVLLSDNFDGENGGVATLNYANFANFTVSTGSVDLIGNGSFDLYPGNGLYVDLAGSTGQFGALTSKLVFGPGTYTMRPTH